MYSLQCSEISSASTGYTRRHRNAIVFLLICALHEQFNMMKTNYSPFRGKSTFKSNFLPKDQARRMEFRGPNSLVVDDAGNMIVSDGLATSWVVRWTGNSEGQPCCLWIRREWNSTFTTCGSGPSPDTRLTIKSWLHTIIPICLLFQFTDQLMQCKD